jgi:hypothetical protein
MVITEDEAFKPNTNFIYLFIHIQLGVSTMFGTSGGKGDAIEVVIGNVSLSPSQASRTENVTCRFSAQKGTQIDILVYDILEMQAVQEFSVTATGDEQSFVVNTGSLNSGEYMVKLNAGRDVKIAKFNVM